jgi:xanthosine utilization system XapX-like protein
MVARREVRNLPGMTAARSSAPEPHIGVIGLSLLVLGAACVLVSLSTLTWYGARNTGHDSRGPTRFADLHQLAKVTDSSGVSSAYFSWLAWVLLILVLATGIAANIESPASPVLRVVGILLGIAGATATYLALAKLLEGSSSSGGVFHHARLGVWLALLGYVLAGIGAAAGLVEKR